MASHPSDGRNVRLALGAEVFALDGPRLVVGRSRSCDIRLRDDTVSRLHAALVWRGGTLVLEDLGSSNGTWVNGERVLSPRSVAAGDTVRFGSLKGVIETGTVAVTGALVAGPTAPLAPPTAAVVASSVVAASAAAATPGPVASHPGVASASHTHGLVLGKPASFGPRLLALLADVCLFTLGSLVAFLPVAIVTLGERTRMLPRALGTSMPVLPFLAGVCGVLWVLFAFVYIVDGWARRGGSPGMRILGLRLFDWRQRIPIGYGRAWLRLGAALVTVLTLGLGFLLIAVRKDGRALHDILAGTLVAHPPRRISRNRS